MSVITVKTSQGIKRVKIAGDEPTPEEIARMRELFEETPPYKPDVPRQYTMSGGLPEQALQGLDLGSGFVATPQPHMPDAGGTQTLPMPSLPSEYVPAPQPTLPELKPAVRLSPEERALAEGMGQREQQIQRVYEQGGAPVRGVDRSAFFRPRFQEQGPTPLETSLGKGAGMGLGAMTALGLEATGDPERAKQIDENIARIPHEPGVAGLVQGVAQFLTPLGPAAKAAGALKAGPITTTALTSAGVGFAGFSGQQGRLADLVREHTQIAKPVTDFLATDPDDSFAEGRLKNALEFFGLDVAIIAPFSLALRALKGSAASAKPHGEVELANEISKGVKTADPNHVVKPPKDGNIQVAHAGAIRLPDPVVEKISRTISKVFDGVNRVREAPIIRVGLSEQTIRPLSSSVEEISPYFANNLTRFEVEQNVLRNEYLSRVAPFLENYGRMSTADKTLFSRHAFNSDVVNARNVLKKYKNKKGMKQITDNFENMRDVFDDLQNLANENGIEVAYTKHYFPRMLDDYDGFLKAIGKDPDKKLDDLLQKSLDDALKEKQQTLTKQAAANNRPAPQNMALTDFERQDVARKFLEKLYRGDGRQGWQMNRVTAKIDKKHLKFYGGFGSNVQRYVNNLTYRVSKNRFTGESPLAPGGGYKKEVAERLADGRLRPKEAQELERLFDVRLRGGEQSVGDGYRTLANLTYMSTIANPISTLTQASEAFLNAFRNGAFHTAETAGKTITGKGIRLKDLDLEIIAKEMVDPIATTSGRGWVSKFQKGTRYVLDKTLGWSLFRKLDFLMKESNLNGALARAQKQLKNTNSPEYKDFVARQSKFFEGETQGLVDAIKRGDISDPNVKTFLYAKLSRTQPISLSEYPEYYIKYKHARPFYFLKSFGLKQLETTRREVLRKLASGNANEVREGMKQGIRLSLFFGGGTAGVNTLKDYLLDRDDKPGMLGDQWPTRERLASNAMDGFLTLYGLSKFSVNRIADRPGAGTIELFLPPRVQEFGEGFVDLLRGDPDKLYRVTEKSVPLVGKLFSAHFGTAADYKRKKRIQAAKAKGSGGKSDRPDRSKKTRPKR